MGGIGGLLGMGGGASGSGFAAPEGTNMQQINQSYDQTQAGINQQQQFVNALGQQNGLNNQSQVYNQMQGVINGTGPNPAQAQLNQATGQNVSNQAALMAGQRGSNANAGLIARQAAMQGANTQQQAVGQGATLQANQSLNALNQSAGIANTQVAQQQAGLSALNSNSLQQQQNLLGIQGNMNTANAGLAHQSQSSQNNMMGNVMGSIGSVGSLIGGGGSSPMASTPGPIMAGGAGDAIGGADPTSLLAANGGQVQRRPLFADGGMPDQGAINGQLTGWSGAADQTNSQGNGGNSPQSNAGRYMSGDTSGMAGGAGQAGGSSGGGPNLGSMINTGKNAYNAYSKIDAANTSAADTADSNAVDELTAMEDAPAATDTAATASSAAPDAAAGASDALSSAGSSAADFFGGTSGTAAGEAGQGVGDFFSGLGDMFGSIFDLGSGAVGDVAGGAADAVSSGAAGDAALGIGETAAVAAAKGGRAHRNVPALVSPGEHILSPKDVQKVAKGASPMAVSKKVPGKPKVGGAVNSYANDTVPKNLAEGSIVLPRSVTESKNPQWQAHKFVAQIMAKNGGKLPK